MRRRTFLGAAGAATLLAGRVPAAGKQYFAYWGTYTTSLPRFANGKSNGIYVSRFDAETGKLSTPELAAETRSPSYLAVHPSGRFLYAVNELGAEDTETAAGYMTAFAIDPKTGKLEELNRASTKGVMPCHVDLDRTGAMAAAANWSSASTVSIPVPGMAHSARPRPSSSIPGKPHTATRSISLRTIASSSPPTPD